MTRKQKAKVPKRPEPLVLKADLPPADAAETRDLAQARLEEAEAASAPLTVDIEGERPTPCALQILVATTKSAERRGIDLSPTAEAQTVLSSLDPT